MSCVFRCIIHCHMYSFPSNFCFRLLGFIVVTSFLIEEIRKALRIFLLLNEELF
jgi:hypothetical protein